MRATAILLTVFCLSLMASAASAASHPWNSARLMAPALLGQVRSPSGSAEATRDAESRDASQPSGRYTLSDESDRAAGERPSRSASDPKSQSRGMLREARRALAQDDPRRASELVGQVKRLGVTFTPQEDSPEKIESLLRRAQQTAAGAPNNDQAAHAREQAQLLMDQAEGLLRYQDFAAAQELAQRAGELPVQYQPFDQTPDRLLGRIDAARRANAKAAPAPGGRVAEPRGLTELEGPGRPRRLAGPTSSPKKQQVQQLISAATAAMKAGDLPAARDFAMQAESLAVPDNQFGDDELKPWQIRKQIEDQVVRRNLTQPGSPPGERYALSDEGESGGRFPVAQGVYDPARDRTRNAQAQATERGTPTASAAPGAGGSAGMRLYQEGLRALEQQDRPGALDRFKEAWKYEAELEPAVRRDLMTKLSLLQAAPGALPPNEQLSPLEEVDAQEQLRRQQLTREILNEQKAAEREAADDPNAALIRLQKLRDRVREAEVTPGSKKQLLTLVDRSISELQEFLERNRQQIAQDQHNREVLRNVEDERLKTIEVQNQIAKMVEDFNTLVDERRYAEAEVIAKKADEIAPRDPVVVNLVEKSRFLRRIAADAEIRADKEEGFIQAMLEVDRAAIPGDDGNSYRFNERLWRDLSRDRRRTLERMNLNFSRADAEIHKKLKTEVDVRFNEQPLADVLNTLGALANVNVYLDPQGLAVEGVAIDTPVTINLREPISLRSALNLILQPLQLSYIVEDGVVRITNEDAQKENVYAKVYNVADLVIPIPNFVPTQTTNLQEAIRESYQAMGYGSATPPSGTTPLLLSANQKDATTDGSVLAQVGASGSLGTRPTQLSRYGLGAGGSTQADFDGLIDLITSVIQPSSWDEVGGTGSVQGFDTNLSLVISTTQETHDQIADLLDQLRRLQDLQVTIEMRFITLSDNFFERIGVDFNFDIDDNTGFSPQALGLVPGTAGDPRLEDSRPSMVVGLNPLPGARSGTADGDLRFTQGSFGASLPPFGAFDAGSAANFGFAILSDIEAFFVITAASGDSRTNVLQAPKVTMFNGQSASVLDQSQRPFVTSIIPVVADFAVAQQPVITVLNEGTSLSVQAVVSSDRRFVRLTLVPSFTTIGDVETFRFAGSDSSDTGTTKTEDRDDQGNVDRATTMANNFLTQQGSVVQLPTFNFTTVLTTVSVPDGGTVLLGGIKRLREGRTERGVPILSKLPYISRLFKNVGIGRETTSLMMMVTPRIIIQEEEEERQTGYTAADQ